MVDHLISNDSEFGGNLVEHNRRKYLAQYIMD